MVDDKTLGDIGKHHGKTSVQVSLRWLVQHGIAVIPKSSGSHLRENMEIFDFSLTKDEMETIDSMKVHRRLVSPRVKTISSMAAETYLVVSRMT